MSQTHNNTDERIARLETDVVAIKGSIEHIGATLTSLQPQLMSIGKANVQQIVVGLVGTAATGIAAVWIATQLMISPMAVQIEALGNRIERVVGILETHEGQDGHAGAVVGNSLRQAEIGNLKENQQRLEGGFMELRRVLAMHDVSVAETNTRQDTVLEFMRAGLDREREERLASDDQLDETLQREMRLLDAATSERFDREDVRLQREMDLKDDSLRALATSQHKEVMAITDALRAEVRSIDKFGSRRWVERGAEQP